MKYFVYRTEEGKIYRVDSRIHYINKTDEEIDEAFKNFNDNHKQSVEVLDLDGTLGEAFAFSLGDGTYKSLRTITDLVERLDSLKDNIDSISYDISDMVGSIENCMNDIKKLEEE